MKTFLTHFAIAFALTSVCLGQPPQAPPTQEDVRWIHNRIDSNCADITSLEREVRLLQDRVDSLERVEGVAQSRDEVVFFTNPGCDPCTQVPLYESPEVTMVSGFDHPRAVKAGINSVPMIHYLVDGKVKVRTPYATSEDIARWRAEYLNASRQQAPVVTLTRSQPTFRIIERRPAVSQPVIWNNGYWSSGYCSSCSRR
ncbi:MAG: hypothetical protein HC841_00410 [Verrucomicrobiae bacterium]|nr:hypothetical protein [Verrucomicrobiae bacterium]